jgi:hypothetical protein
VQCIADKVRRGLVASDQEEGAEAKELGHCEVLSLDLRPDKAADQVAARSKASLLDQPLKVHRHLAMCLPATFGSAHNCIRPGLEAVALLDWHTEELGYDNHRERVGEVCDGLEQAAVDHHPVKKLLGNRRYMWRQVLDRTLRKGFRQKGAQLSMAWWIGRDQARFEDGGVSTRRR